MKSHCKRGHELTPENLRPARGRGRECVTCHRTRYRNFAPVGLGSKKGEPGYYPCGHPRVLENMKAGKYPNCLTCHREKQRQRYRDNPDSSIAAAKAWAKANREKLYARIREWKIRHPEQATRKVIRHPRQQGVADSETLMYATRMRHDPCAYCAGKGGSLDHIVAVARDGETLWTNFTVACKSCNSSKNAKSLIEFLWLRAATIESRPLPKSEAPA